MKIYSEIIGNINTDANWAGELKEAEIEYLDLDQWTAQKSRFASTSDRGNEYAVSLERNSRINDGDILFEDARHREHGGGIGYVVAAADDLLAVAVVAQTPRLQYARIAERFGIEAQRVDVGYVGESGHSSPLSTARVFSRRRS